jgi:hypothetical protein
VAVTESASLACTVARITFWPASPCIAGWRTRVVKTIDYGHRWRGHYDDGSRQKTEDVAFEDIGGNALAKPPMCLAKLTIEPHPPALSPMVQSAPSVLELTFQLRLSVTNAMAARTIPSFVVTTPPRLPSTFGAVRDDSVPACWL